MPKTNNKPAAIQMKENIVEVNMLLIINIMNQNCKRCLSNAFQCFYHPRLNDEISVADTKITRPRPHFIVNNFYYYLALKMPTFSLLSGS